MIRGAWLGAVLLAATSSVAQSQTVVELRDPGPGVGPQRLARALAAPHALIESGVAARVIPRDSAFSQTVISIGRTVVVNGTVHGDLIVVDADVVMHPGGRVDGRAIAIGGGVYESMLAQTGGVIAYHDFSYDAQPISGGYALTYRAAPVDTAPAFRAPGAYGLRLPTYDRIDGLSLAFAPQFRVLGSRVAVEPSLTYRSNLGRLDPGLAVTDALSARTELRADLRRSTFSNDDWIWSDLVNSTEFLLFGEDMRNYYRATRGTLTLSQRWETVSSTLEPYVGARWERADNVARDSGDTIAPWTFFGRHDVDDAQRANPATDPETLGSAIAGARLRWTDGDIIAAAQIDGELGWPIDADVAAPCVSPCPNASFGQATFNGRIKFRTFGAQSLSFDGHAVASTRNTPRQRWAYLGGPGTIRTLETLERGGDELVFVDARYTIPFDRIKLPFVGSPDIILREVLGGAAVDAFPGIAQATGVRVGLSIVYVEALVDPVTRHVSSGFGFSFAK